MIKAFEISSLHSYTRLVLDVIVKHAKETFIIFFTLCNRNGNFECFLMKNDLMTVGVKTYHANAMNMHIKVWAPIIVIMWSQVMEHLQRVVFICQFLNEFIYLFYRCYNDFIMPFRSRVDLCLDIHKGDDKFWVSINFYIGPTTK